MKVLDILGFFIIVGILGFRFAETSQYVSGYERVVYERVADWMRNIRQRSCETNGDPKGFEAYESSCRAIQECTLNMMMESHEANVKTARSSGKLDSQLPLYCNKLPAFRECIKPHMNNMRSCENPEIKKINDISYKTLTRFTDFACNNTEKIAELMADGGAECMLSKYKDLLICAEDIISFGIAVAAKYTIRQSYGGLESISPLKFGSDCSVSGCQMIESFQDCSIRVLDECKVELPAELLKSMFEYVNQDIPCKNLIK